MKTLRLNLAEFSPKYFASKFPHPSISWVGYDGTWSFWLLKVQLIFKEHTAYKANWEAQSLQTLRFLTIRMSWPSFAGGICHHAPRCAFGLSAPHSEPAGEITTPVDRLLEVELARQFPGAKLGFGGPSASLYLESRFIFLDLG